MDLVGAAAGYIAKQLHLSTEKSCSCESCREVANGGFSGSSSCSRNRYTQKRKLVKDPDVNGKEIYDVFTADPWMAKALSEEEPVSSLLDSSQERNLLSGLSNLMVTEGVQCVEPARHRGKLRIKHFHGREVKPLNSLESCILAQMYNEQVRAEEGPRSCFPSPSRTRRPSKESSIFKLEDEIDIGCYQSYRNGEDFKLREKTNANGATLNQPNSILNGQQGKRSSSSKPIGQALSNQPTGLCGGSFQFTVGMCIGLIASLVATRIETDELNNRLKESEHLVQDLQEELEMKDSLTVKELASESNATSRNCISNEEFDIFNHQHNDDAPEDGSLFMSKIEAELELELERLGLNMSSSKPQNSNYNIDEEYEADFAEGELMIQNCISESGSLSDVNGEYSSNSTVHYGDYAVSPRELSLRLHKVIQSRLENRVKELEDALEASQQKVSNLAIDLRYSSDEETKTSFDPFKLVMEYDSTSYDILDDNEEDDDDEEKQLIKQIVEKTKKGSPVVLNAQKLLFDSGDDPLNCQ